MQPTLSSPSYSGVCIIIQRALPIPDRQCRVSISIWFSPTTHADSSLFSWGSIQTSKYWLQVQPDALRSIEESSCVGWDCRHGVVQGLQVATDHLRSANYHPKPVYISVLHRGPAMILSLYFSEEGGAALGWISCREIAH